MLNIELIIHNERRNQPLDFLFLLKLFNINVFNTYKTLTLF